MREEIKPIDRLFVRSYVYEDKIPTISFDYTMSQPAEIEYIFVWKQYHIVLNSKIFIKYDNYCIFIIILQVLNNKYEKR